MAGQLWEQKAWTQQVSLFLYVKGSNFHCVGVLFCDISFSLYIFVVYLVIFCTFHLCCHSCPSLSCVMCSSVQLHSSLEGDWEYLLLEECESKPLPPQTSLWVASHPAGTACLCGVRHMYWKKDKSTETHKHFIQSAVDLHGFYRWLLVLDLRCCRSEETVLILSLLACFEIYSPSTK